MLFSDVIIFYMYDHILMSKYVLDPTIYFIYLLLQQFSAIILCHWFWMLIQTRLK